MDAHNDTEKNALKLSKREFIAFMAEQNKTTLKAAARAYDMVIESIQSAVAAGNELCLMGFGRFYLQTHKGHPVRFKDDPDGGASDSEREVPDYMVFKFSASNALNQRIRKNAGPGTAGDGV